MKKNLFKRGILITLLAIAALAVLLTGCGSSNSSDNEDTTIRVGASITPHSEILNEAKPILAEEGINLEVVEIEDVITPNTGVAEGTLDANFFQHQPYLDDFNSQNGTNLVSIGAVHYEPLGIYSEKLTSLSDIEDGAQIAVPNNVTNEARALLLLEQEGVITLKAGVGIEATVNDIEDNPHHIEIVEVDPSQLANSLKDVTAAVINGNYALEGGLSISDALAVEADDSVAAKTYENIVVTTEENKDNPALLRLVEVLQSNEIKDFINSNYKGAVVPIS